MKKRSLVLRIVLYCIAAVIALAVVYAGYLSMRQRNNSLSTLFGKKLDASAADKLDTDSKKQLDEELSVLNPSSSPGNRPVINAAISATEPVKTDMPATANNDIMDILVLGVDSRAFQLDSQTDCMLLIRVDKARKIIKIVSISRDIYLNIPGYTENRINEACVYGGPELVMKTLNQAFGLNIQRYIVFDFRTAEEMIDMMGKVTVNVDKDELDAINGYIAELNRIATNGKKADPLTHTGIQQLNGRQAVAYARLRPNQGSDIVRMGRQREVLLSLMQTAKKLKPEQVLPLVNKAKDVFYTNLPLMQFPSFALDMYSVKDGKFEQLAIPIDGSYKEVNIVEMKFLVIDFDQNTEALQKFLNN